MANAIETRLPMFMLVLASFLMVLFSPLVLSDGLVVKPYSHSSISSTNLLSSDDYLILLSAPKRVNNQLRVEKELRANISGLNETYRINDGHTTEQAFKYYLSQLKQLGAKIIYQCASRDCGRSSSWAEGVYRNSKLYGKDATQFYFAAAVQSNGEQWLVTVYTVERGNRRVYAHIETLKVNAPLESGGFQDLFVEQPSLFIFSFDFKKTIQLNVDSAEIKKIIDQVEGSPSSSVYIVGHMSQGYESTVDALKQSLNAAEQLSIVLQKRGVAVEKISTLGVGPLIPVNQGIRTGNRVEVIVLSK
jgi:outer membrane protein OmpA-like peptidoglycan-associated protein